MTSKSRSLAQHIKAIRCDAPAIRFTRFHSSSLSLVRWIHHPHLSLSLSHSLFIYRNLFRTRQINHSSWHTCSTTRAKARSRAVTLWPTVKRRQHHLRLWLHLLRHHADDENITIMLLARAFRRADVSTPRGAVRIWRTRDKFLGAT